MKRWKIVLLVVIALFAAGAIYATVLVRRGFSARENPSWVEAFAAGIAKSLAVPATYRLKNPYAPTAENVREGEEHFADHCAICHANDGSGDALFGKGLYPKPPNMRDADTQNKSDGELYYTIANGVRLSGMPAFGPPSGSISGKDQPTGDAETWKLVLFIRHLPQITSEELEDMKKLNPKTEADRAEEQQEEEFLNGGEAPKRPAEGHQH
ncbi:MAG: cytochrome C [Acidobacteria bacterium]|nr:MAG: cytochrome C [Acidobacteriota bacterium]